MSTTDIDICTHALVMIGANPITSFADGTTESIAAANLYETTVRDQMGRYRWRFATAQSQMSRLSDAPLSGWDAAYQLPATMLMPITVKINDVPIDFDRFEDNIFCNATEEDTVILEGVYRVDEQFWPPYFVTLVQLALASHFALTIAAQGDLSDLIDKRALRQAAIARNLDAQARTTPRIDTGSLVRARMRGTRR